MTPCGKSSGSIELFDWRALAEHGVGVWPANPVDGAGADMDAVADLTAFGYCVEDLPAAVRAFQRHFRPRRVSGKMDAETKDILAALVLSF